MLIEIRLFLNYIQFCFRILITQVNSQHINRIFTALLKLIKNHANVENALWLCRVNCRFFWLKFKNCLVFAVQIIQNVTNDPVKDYMLPIAELLRRMAEKAFREEERIRTHPDDADENTVAEDNARLVRSVYAFFPLVVKVIREIFKMCRLLF